MRELGQEPYLLQPIGNSSDILILDCKSGRSQRQEIINYEVPTLFGIINLQCSALIAGGCRNNRVLSESVKIIRNVQTVQPLPFLSEAKYGPALADLED